MQILMVFNFQNNVVLTLLLYDRYDDDDDWLEMRLQRLLIGQLQRVRWLCTIRNPNRIKTVPDSERERCTMRSQTRISLYAIELYDINCMRMHSTNALRTSFNWIGTGCTNYKNEPWPAQSKRKRSRGDEERSSLKGAVRM